MTNPDVVHAMPEILMSPKQRHEAWRNVMRAEVLVTAASRKRAKDVLEEILEVLMEMATEFQPWPAAKGRNANEDRDLFDRYIVLAMKCASELAPYQSPKAVIIKNEHNDASSGYDLDRLSDDQLLTLRTLMIAAQPTGNS